MPSIITILVVDDEFGNAEVLSLILEEAGYRVHQASNGAEGLRQAEELKPDIVLADFMMPVMNGADMAKALRAGPGGRDLKIVMNSSLAEPVIRKYFDDYDAFLQKPFDVERLLEVIERLIDPPASQ